MNPWVQFKPPGCFPDNCGCELIRDSFIRHPVNFWTSFAYLGAAIAIYRGVAVKGPELRMWTAVCALMGFSSLFGHASMINFALAFDFAAIILVLSFFAVLKNLLNWQRSINEISVILLIYYLGLFVMMYHLEKWTKITICLLILIFSLREVMKEAGLSFLKARNIQISLLTLTLSFAMFLVDELHLNCSPQSWFQWHSMWHLGTAVSMYYYGKWRFEGA